MRRKRRENEEITLNVETSGPRGLKLNQQGLIGLESMMIQFQTSWTTSFKMLVFNTALCFSFL